MPTVVVDRARTPSTPPATYLNGHLAEPKPGHAYNALQQLAYFAVVFLLAPFQIATGAAMSPSIIARFPRYARLFGGKQAARTLHFLGLCAFAAFVVVHTVMVLAARPRRRVRRHRARL